MTPYILLLASNLILMWLAPRIENGKKVYFWISVVSLALFAGLRGFTTGTDTGAYHTIFDRIKVLDSFAELMEVREEIGYVLINKFVAVCGGTVNGVFLICGFVTAYGFIKFIDDNTDNLYFGVFLLLCLMIFFNSMNQVRQFMAIAIAINGWTCLKKKKFITFFMLIFVSVLFQKIGIVYLALLPIYYMSKSSISQLVFYILLIALMVFAEPVITFFAKLLHFEHYLNDGGGQRMMLLVVYGALAVFPFISLMMNNKVLEKNADTTMLVVSAFVVQLLSSVLILLYRIATMLVPFATVLIPNVVAMFEKRDRKYAYIFIGIIGIAYYIYCVSVNWEGIYPYIPFWHSATN